MSCPQQHCVHCNAPVAQPGPGVPRCGPCEDELARDYDAERDHFEDDYNEPIGSCDECGCNLYEDDDWDGLCNQCAWLAEQG